MLPPPPRPGPKLPTDSDAAVRGTNDDATASKLCVCSLRFMYHAAPRL